MKSYPYIGKFQQSIKLFYDINQFIEIACGHGSNRHESNYTNITPEYLANTYGEVVSPEHAEFIIELAELHGFKFDGEESDIIDTSSFAIYESDFDIYPFSIEKLSCDGLRKITIPLPPKQIQTATPEEEFEMKQIEKFNRYSTNVKVNNNTESEVRATKSDNDTVTITVDKPIKNAGDNLVLGCEQDFKVAREIINELRKEANCSDELLASRDEWPKIGDEVLVYSSARRLAEIKGKAVKVIGKFTHSDGSTIITVEHSSLGVFAAAKESCIKPKTPEEDLRDDAIKDMSQSIRNKVPKINWDEAESISSDLYDFGYRKPQ